MEAEGELSTNNKFVEHLSVSILTNTIEELRILKSINTNKDVSAFGNIYNCDKLLEELGYIEEIFIDAVYEIIEKHTFNVMKQIVVKENKQIEEDNNLLQNVKSSMLKLADLKKEIRFSDEEWYFENKDKEESLGKLKDEYENLIMEFKIKENYVCKWQSSQMEQTRMKIKIQEDKLRESLRKDNDNIENELRVNLETIIYLTHVITGFEDKVKFWSEKYENDLKAMDDKIAWIKNEKLSIQSRIVQINDLYYQRDMEMKNYQVLKEEKRLEAEEKARYNANAIIVQAWWRGVMVRRKLGPYKPKKSRRGKGKKQKK